MVPTPTHILWDHDGVLVDTEPFYFDATQRALREIGISIVPRQYQTLEMEGLSAWDLARAAGIDEETIATHRARRDAYYQEHLRTADIDIAGVEPLLEQLSREYRMAIVTASKAADFDLIHASRNITPYMEFVLKNGDYPRGKPAPDPYLTALERFGITAENAVVVEDSERGLRSAVSAGIRCIVVSNAFMRGADFSGAAAVIDSLAELPEVLSA